FLVLAHARASLGQVPRKMGQQRSHHPQQQRGEAGTDQVETTLLVKGSKLFLAGQANYDPERKPVQAADMGVALDTIPGVMLQRIVITFLIVIDQRTACHFTKADLFTAALDEEASFAVEQSQHALLPQAGRIIAAGEIAGGNRNHDYPLEVAICIVQAAAELQPADGEAGGIVI